VTDKKPTVGAPGMSVTAATAEGNITLSGTSMATPVVSGSVAKAIAANPSLKGSPADVRAHVKAHADRMENAGTTEVGAGRVNVKRLVENVEPDESQADARNDPAKNRDRANKAIAGSFWTEVLG
jgi:serine protease AprX